ncbi:MAG TPA: hypothetical protein G4O15_06745 [Dehalococcoidia bacterium]|nr:hypothetical protein [Dehalococcoidia bacterium]
MAFDVGDQVIYEDKGIDGERIKGVIIDIWKNNRKKITNYFVMLDSGIYVQITSHNLKWNKVEAPALIPA